LKRIEKWIRVHSAPKNRREFERKFNWLLYCPTQLLLFLARIRLWFFVVGLLDYWLAFDLYPEHRKDAESILRFLLQIAKVEARSTGAGG
jgi:hypothetical protein